MSFYKLLNPTKGIERHITSLGTRLTVNRNPTKGIERAAKPFLTFTVNLQEPNKGNWKNFASWYALAISPIWTQQRELKASRLSLVANHVYANPTKGIESCILLHIPLICVLGTQQRELKGQYLELRLYIHQSHWTQQRELKAQNQPIWKL